MDTNSISPADHSFPSNRRSVLSAWFAGETSRRKNLSQNKAAPNASDSQEIGHTAVSDTVRRGNEMIATEAKDFEDILKALSETDSVYIVGCGDCAAVLQTGGEFEVAEMKDRLEQAGKTVTGTVVPEVTCQVLDIKRILRHDREAVEKADAILVLACGAGIQAVAEVVENRPVIAGLDTLFSANKFRAGQFYEWCSACGECIVDQYGGICPITRCPKGQLNGPCGGTNQGKCEVDPEKDCVWTLIYRRAEQLGVKDVVDEHLADAKDYTKSTRPRQRVFEPRRT